MASDLKKSRFSFFFGLFFVAISVSIWQGYSWWQRAIAPVAINNPTKNKTDRAIEFNVASGTSGQQIGQQLAEAGLISSLDAWKLWVWWQQKQDQQGGFKAGVYLLSPQDSLPTIASKIWRGEIMQTTFTIPEGWSIKQMADYFARSGYFPAADFIAATRQIPYDRYPWLPKNIPYLEGFLYPDTYKISSDRIHNPQAIIEIMLNQFQKIALPVFEKAQTDLTLQEWVTLASVVEKEAVIPKERPLIAGVFTSRLKKGMRLESDPTVEYGLGIKQTADRPLTYDEVGTPSPYNTYLNSGLPPTAIASPGIASLEATLDPTITEYLYFVARYDGTHIFSKTLSEHEAATQAIRRSRQTDF